MKGTKNYASLSDPARNSQFGRRWVEPHHVADVAHKVMLDTAVRAVGHWLQQADTLKGKDRIVCLETADVRTAEQ